MDILNGRSESRESREGAVRKRGRLIAAAAVSAWLFAVVAGLVLLNGWANAPGPATAPPRKWPAESGISRAEDRATVILFGHPRCPCTRATLGELDLVLARFQGRMEVHVVFVKPAESGEDWAGTDLWRRASAMPGVRVHLDDGGIEARLFRSRTSGHVLAYGGNGLLLFDGGITGSRGHSGDNPARMALEEILGGKRARAVKKAVFGCPLFEPDEQEGGYES